MEQLAWVPFIQLTGISSEMDRLKPGAMVNVGVPVHPDYDSNSCGEPKSSYDVKVSNCTRRVERLIVKEREDSPSEKSSKPGRDYGI